MTGRIDAFLGAIVIVTTVPAVAQWLNVPTKGIPRTKDGKPDLTERLCGGSAAREVVHA
jgi:hypothetical protein